MPALLIDQPYDAFGVAEGDHFLAHDLDLDRVAISLGQLTGGEDGNPEAAHRFAHGGTRPGWRMRILSSGDSIASPFVICEAWPSTKASWHQNRQADLFVKFSYHRNIFYGSNMACRPTLMALSRMAGACSAPASAKGRCIASGPALSCRGQQALVEERGADLAAFPVHRLDTSLYLSAHLRLRNARATCCTLSRAGCQP